MATVVPPEGGGNVPAPRRAPTGSARRVGNPEGCRQHRPRLHSAGPVGFVSRKGDSCGGRHLPWAASAGAPPGRPYSRGSSAVRVVKDRAAQGTVAAQGGVPAPGYAKPPPTPTARKDILQAFHQQRLPDARGPQQQTHPDPAPGNRGSAPDGAGPASAPLPLDRPRLRADHWFSGSPPPPPRTRPNQRPASAAPGRPCLLAAPGSVRRRAGARAGAGRRKRKWGHASLRRGSARGVGPERGRHGARQRHLRASPR